MARQKRTSRVAGRAAKARRRVVVIGAGGVGREVRWMLEQLDEAGARMAFAGFVVSDLTKLGPRDSRDEVRGDLEWLLAHRRQVDAVAVAIGTPARRLAVAAALGAHFDDERLPALIHPAASWDRGTCTIEPGAIVYPAVSLTVNVRVGRFAMLSPGCTVGHESTIGAGSVLLPGAGVAGGVAIEQGVLVGAGAQVLQYLRVGANATVGAGAVVTKNVAAGATVVGVPARPLPRP